jgi:hypothetical protein
MHRSCGIIPLANAAARASARNFRRPHPTVEDSQHTHVVRLRQWIPIELDHYIDNHAG